jgi:hypothetical protein
MKIVLSCERIKHASKPYDGKIVKYGYKKGALKAQKKTKF